MPKLATLLCLLATAAAFQPPRTLPGAAQNFSQGSTDDVTPSSGSRNRRTDVQTIRRPRRPRAPVAPEAGKPTDEKEKMSAWETYTDGEYGQAFKFPWEVEASDKTAIGHVIPIVATLAILLPARINAGLDLLPHP